MTTITHTITDRFRNARELSRERREHDRAMRDPRIRDEHYAGRRRDIAAGGADCHFCS